jgi:hypothetical protein
MLAKSLRPGADMMKVALALLPILVRERDYFLGLAKKYSELPDQPAADGEALIAIIKKYEPLVFEMVKGGFSVAKAIAIILARTFTPHPMTPEEEDAWFKRASQNGEF